MPDTILGTMKAVVLFLLTVTGACICLCLFVFSIVGLKVGQLISL